MWFSFEGPVHSVRTNLCVSVARRLYNIQFPSQFRNFSNVMEPAALHSVHSNATLAAPYAAQSNPCRISSFHLHLGLPVCIVTCLQVEQPRHPDSIPTRTTDLSVPRIFTLAMGPNRRPVQWVPVALSPGTKQPICEAGRSYPGTDVNKGSYTSTPLHVFRIVTGIRLI